MDLILSDDQVALRDGLRHMLTERLSPKARRSGFDRDLFRHLAELGVFSLTIPESDGGVGLGLAEAAIVFEELGRAAVPGPLIATFLAAGRVPGASSGSTIVGLATRAHVGGHAIEHPLDIDSILLVDDDRAIDVTPVPYAEPVERPLDPLTPVGYATVHNGGHPIGDAEGLRRAGAVIVAAMQVGLGQTALELGVQHALDREQFGRPIGAFQAVKHQLADAAVALETARAGVHQAAVVIDEGGDSSGRGCFGARIVASDAADQSCRTAIQVHGGMGFTWELDVHLLLKRVMVLDTALGGVDLAVERVATAVIRA